jgi:hypothetical protein
MPVRRTIAATGGELIPLMAEMHFEQLPQCPMANALEAISGVIAEKGNLKAYTIYNKVAQYLCSQLTACSSQLSFCSLI